MKKLIPWWLKIGFKILLSRIPLKYTFWQSIGLFRHGEMDQSSYVVNVFREHVSRAELDGKLSGKTILELGPGDSIATAIVAASYGARAILIDAGDFASKDLEKYQQLVSYLTELGLSPPDISSAHDLGGILRVCNSQYLVEGVKSFSAIESNSVDLIFSQAVLEHVRKKEFAETMLECRRILAEGGVASHRVDLKDHLGGGLNNLRFRDSLWESEFFVKSGFYTNRIRYSEMLSLFRSAGFSADVLRVDRWDKLPIDRSDLNANFSDLDDDELMVSGFDVLLTAN